jgi:Leucine-rich repeat (LRR) protein
MFDARDRGILDLTGLEHATNLTELSLQSNQISDVSALASLTNLTEHLTSRTCRLQWRQHMIAPCLVS